MAKQILFDENARRKVLRGVETLSKAVKGTLGPKGRNVLIDKKFGSPTVTKDGVTVAKEIELEDIDLKDHKRLAVMDAMSQEGRHRPSQEEIAAKMAAKEKTAV